MKIYRGRQTRGSGAERVAVAQYTNPVAYEYLQNAIYPMNLPFDLYWETIRTYLGHLRTSQAEILDTCLPGEREDILEHPSLVHETLGINAREAAIITGDDGSLDEPWKLWGFEGENSGRRQDTFEFQSGLHQASKARVILYLAADVFTLGLAELILWPMELTVMERATCIGIAIYDQSQKAESWVVRKKSSEGGVQEC